MARALLQLLGEKHINRKDKKYNSVTLVQWILHFQNLFFIVGNFQPFPTLYLFPFQTSSFVSKSSPIGFVEDESLFRALDEPPTRDPGFTWHFCSLYLYWISSPLFSLFSRGDMRSFCQMKSDILQHYTWKRANRNILNSNPSLPHGVGNLPLCSLSHWCFSCSSHCSWSKPASDWEN